MTAESQPTRKRRRSSMCVGCGGQIQDQYILRVAPDLEWHASCLKCADCNQYLDESCTCFVRDGKTYCKQDYVRLFGSKCTKCSQSFSQNDFVMRARNKIFHIDCFRCVACSRQLIPGDEFALRDDGLFCKADHEVFERPVPNGQTCGLIENNNNSVDAQNNNNGEGSPNSSSSSTINNNNESKSDSTSKSHKSGSETITTTHGRTGRPHGGGHGKSDHKPTRVRTVLNEKQLHTLRTCYAANPRPDALMKEQLTEMTGLSARVIRVWFQNKRCKDKKRSIAMKQMQQQQEKNGGLQRPLQGVPMVASSPVRHESNLQPNPVEVTSYQPPWKALSEFAMQGDLDQPPFQQLVNSFDHHDSVMNGHLYMTHDDLLSHPPNSVSSEAEIPGTPSELSSPMSQ